MSTKFPVIGIIGGSGSLGSGLALRWARAGYPIVIGSRREEKAKAAAQEIRQILAECGIDATVTGDENAKAAKRAHYIALTVPFAQHQSTLSYIAPHLEGKILIDATVPLGPPNVETVQLPESGSAVVSAQRLLGEKVRVVSAFQNVAAEKLRRFEPLECDVLVTGNDQSACAEVISLVNAAGLRGLYAGPLVNSAAAEALTSVLITINRQFKCQAGVRIVGID